MPTPCRLVRIFPRYYSQFERLFLQENVNYVYHTVEYGHDQKVYLKIYCNPNDEDELGKSCDINIDIPHPFWNRDDGHIIVKSTEACYIRTYRIKNDAVLASFAAKSLTNRVFDALTMVAKEIENINPDDLIIPLFINLKDHEQDLHREFTEVRRFWMKDMPDLYIRGAGISGVKLQNSPEYQRYVRQVGGKLMSMVFRWQGITILLSGDGLIFTYTNFNSNLEASRFFKRIIDKLIKIDALEYPF